MTDPLEFVEASVARVMCGLADEYVYTTENEAIARLVRANRGAVELVVRRLVTFADKMGRLSWYTRDDVSCAIEQVFGEQFLIRVGLQHATFPPTGLLTRRYELASAMFDVVYNDTLEDFLKLDGDQKVCEDLTSAVVQATRVENTCKIVEQLLEPKPRGFARFA